MSMRNYAVDDYGLVLDDEALKVIASKVFDDFSENEDVCDLRYALYDKGLCEYISEFTGESHCIDNDGLYWGGLCETYSYDEIAYIQLLNYPTLFRQAYKNMNEIVDELKSRIGEYLPEDFDYRSRIRHISGTYYG